MKYELITGKDFNKKIPFYDIDCIFFTDEAAPKGVEVTDLSKDGDESVMGWMEDDGVYKVSTQVENQKILFNENCIEMFANRKELKRIEFKMVDTTKVEYMVKMFYNCEKLKELDFGLTSNLVTLL